MSITNLRKNKNLHKTMFVSLPLFFSMSVVSLSFPLPLAGGAVDWRFLAGLPMARVS